MTDETRSRAGLAHLQGYIRDLVARKREQPAEPNPHLTFGHGPHYCIGAPLARIELQSLFGTLFDRFPALQLAVPLEALRPRSHLFTGGLAALPVTW